MKGTAHLRKVYDFIGKESFELVEDFPYDSGGSSILTNG